MVKIPEKLFQKLIANVGKSVEVVEFNIANCSSSPLVFKDGDKLISIFERRNDVLNRNEIIITIFTKTPTRKDDKIKTLFHKSFEMSDNSKLYKQLKKKSKKIYMKRVDEEELKSKQELDKIMG